MTFFSTLRRPTGRCEPTLATHCNLMAQRVPVAPLWWATLALAAGLVPAAHAGDSSALRIEGSGPVTVVFEAGLGDTAEVWRKVQGPIARSCARTVAYTRDGYGFGSRTPRGPRDAEHVVAELRERLAAAHLSPPYVLVGHSLGGLYLQYYARRHPEEVRGLLLVDSTHWDQLARIQADAPGMYRVIRTASFLMGGVMRQEFADSPAAGRQVSALPAPSGLPVIVLSSTKAAPGESAAFRELAAKLQDEMAAAYPAQRHEFVAGSGHYIQRDRPEAVIRAARELAGCSV